MIKQRLYNRNTSCLHIVDVWKSKHHQTDNSFSPKWLSSCQEQWALQGINYTDTSLQLWFLFFQHSIIWQCKKLIFLKFILGKLLNSGNISIRGEVDVIENKVSFIWFGLHTIYLEENSLPHVPNITLNVLSSNFWIN